MNYYYSDGGAGAQGPCSKEELIDLLQQNAISEETQICPEGSQEWYSISSILPAKPSSFSRSAPVQRTTLPAPISGYKAASPRLVSRRQSKEYLENLRQNSCYSTLRIVISILTVLLFISLFVSVVAMAIGAAQVEPNGGLYTGLIALGAGIVGSVVIIAYRQAALLLIDLVDAQIESNSRS